MTDAGDEEFHAAVAKLLGSEHEWRAPVGERRTRWNNRRAGNGRHPGFGVVQAFGDVVRIALRAPVALSVVVEGRDNALRVIENALAAHRRDGEGR